MLNDISIKNLKPKEKLYRILDFDNLYIEISPCGSKLWRIRYTLNGKQQMISAGSYPRVTIRDARRRRDEVLDMVERGEDPKPNKIKKNISSSEQKNQDGYTFKQAAEHWFELNKKVWTDSYTDDVHRRIYIYLMPELGDKLIASLMPVDVLTVLRALEARGLGVTVARCLGICSAIMRLAVAEGLLASDPCRDLQGALAPTIKKNFSAFTTREGAKRVMHAIKIYNGCLTIRNAVMFTALTFVRQNELRFATWQEFDFENNQWLIPAARMKMRRDHIVPLSTQALEILKVQKEISGDKKYVFTFNSRGKPISDNAVRSALRHMGFTNEEMTAHGFRSMASTLLNEQGWRADVIERQLAHVETNKVRGVYNRAEYLAERREMMQSWADFLYTLQNEDQTHSTTGAMQ